MGKVSVANCFVERSRAERNSGEVLGLAGKLLNYRSKRSTVT